MAEKTLNTRIQQKHDIEANWLKAVNFIPKVGEVIVYDIDETHTTPRMKIGDGVKNINELEFIGEKAATPDWNASEGEPGYIENRTHYADAKFGIVVESTTKSMGYREPTLAERHRIQDAFNFYPVVHSVAYVSINDATYETKCRKVVVDSDQYGCLGNIALIEPTFADTGEPFCVLLTELTGPAGSAIYADLYGFFNTTESMIIKIEGVFSEDLRQLDTKFLPNNNILNGNAEGSLRTVNSAEEAGKYSLGINAFAEGKNTFAPGENAHAEGYLTFASGSQAHAEGYHSAAIGSYSHAGGIFTATYGSCAHAEGYATAAVGNYSHAEGKNDMGNYYVGLFLSGEANATTYTIADNMTFEEWAPGTIIFTENDNGTLLGTNPVYAKIIARNFKTLPYTITLDKTLNATEALVSQACRHICPYQGAYGDYSHAEGRYTKAVGRSQHVEGEYNIFDPTGDILDGNVKGTYLHIIGNGTSRTKRSNAHTLDWSGNGWFAGGLKVGGTGQDDTAAVSVLTEKDMTAITNAEIDILFQ